MKQEEIWRPIRNYESIYHISSLGRIKRLNNKHGEEQILTPCKNNRGGYYVVNLCMDGTQKTRTIHQLVAESFLGHIPCGLKLVINHKNFIKTDNRVSNLEIVSNRENTNFKHISTSSEYTGVCFINLYKKWRASIVIEGKLYGLGMFDVETEAKEKYDSVLNNWNNLKIKPIIRKTSSKHKGVSFNKRTKKWVCYILVNGKRTSLGYHLTETEAINAIKNYNLKN